MTMTDSGSETVGLGARNAGARQTVQKDGAEEHNRCRRFVIVLGSLTFAYFVLKVSWVADDAYITLRVVDNFLNGYGLRWNVVERVQAYTHPLWLLVLIPFKAVCASSLLALMIPGWGAALSGTLLLLRQARTACGALTALAALVLSQSVIDFSTSGLENSLSHLLLVGLLAALPSSGGGLYRVTACCGLLLLNRLDLAPLIAPLVVSQVWRSTEPKRVWKSLLGVAPLGLWLTFSTIYYGSPLPNTYFAKLGAGVAAEQLLLQGVRYFFDVALYEPLTLVLAVAGIVAGLAHRRQDVAAASLATGMGLHLLYVFWAGGDFMNARFLTPDVVAAAWIGMRSVDRKAVGQDWPVWVRTQGAMLGAVVVAAGLVVSDYHSFASRKAPSIRPSSITDERQFYFSATSLWLRWWEYLKDGRSFEAVHAWVDLGHRLRAQQPPNRPFVHDNMGFLGYYSGPGVHIVDSLGITDAFVARLPVDVFWTAGHGKRFVPEEYLESLSRGHNVIGNPQLRGMFDDVAIVTRSKGLFADGRLVAMWRLGTGYYRSVGVGTRNRTVEESEGVGPLVQRRNQDGRDDP